MFDWYAVGDDGMHPVRVYIRHDLFPLQGVPAWDQAQGPLIYQRVLVRRCLGDVGWNDQLGPHCRSQEEHLEDPSGDCDRLGFRWLGRGRVVVRGDCNRESGIGNDLDSCVSPYCIGRDTGKA